MNTSQYARVEEALVFIHIFIFNNYFHLSRLAKSQRYLQMSSSDAALMPLIHSTWYWRQHYKYYGVCVLCRVCNGASRKQLASINIYFLHLILYWCWYTTYNVFSRNYGGQVTSETKNPGGCNPSSCYNHTVTSERERWLSPPVFLLSIWYVVLEPGRRLNTRIPPPVLPLPLRLSPTSPACPASCTSLLLYSHLFPFPCTRITVSVYFSFWTITTTNQVITATQLTHPCGTRHLPFLRDATWPLHYNVHILLRPILTLSGPEDRNSTVTRAPRKFLATQGSHNNYS